VVRQGQIYRQQGRFELAWEAYQRALKMPKHNVWASQEIYAGMGHIHLAHGEFDEALADYQRAIAEFQKEDKEFEAKLLWNAYLGKLHLVQGRPADALRYYALCLEAAQSRGNYAFECLALVRMCQAYYRQGHVEQLEALASRAEELGEAYGYHQLLADIHLLWGHIALDRALAHREHLDTAIRRYSVSLKDALLYNRYKLDGTIKAIIAHCHQRGGEGSHVLAALRDFWQTNANDEGISLLEAERIARERELGDGTPQVSVVESLEQALKETTKREADNNV